MAEYLKGLFGSNKPPINPATEDGMLIHTDYPKLLAILTLARLRRLCRSPRTHTCFILARDAQCSYCSRSLTYIDRLHKMVPSVGKNQSL